MVENFYTMMNLKERLKSQKKLKLRMKGQTNKQDISDLNSYGLDIQDELSSLLADELAKSIDAEIMKNLFGSDKKKNKINKILEKIKNINDKG